MIESIWIIERKEHGYRPFQDGKWEVYDCIGFGLKVAAEKQAESLRQGADEYTVYRVAEYVRKETR